MKIKKKQQETLTTKIKNAAISLGMGTFIVGSAVAFSLWFNERSQIYNGPVDVPGIERVHARQVHDTNPSFSYLEYAGNNIDVYLADGERASIRDYNGDFQLNGRDSTNGLPAAIDANQVLQETLKKAGHINSYLSIY